MPTVALGGSSVATTSGRFMADKNWAHDALAADLLDWRHGAGEIAIERLHVRGGQLDVAAMRLSWSHPMLTAYEIKISRADFFADVRAGKWRHYIESVERIYFAVPRGMVRPDEVPVECGLLFRGPNGWYARRTAPQRSIDPYRSWGFVQSLLFRHYPAAWQPAARGLLTLPSGARVTADDIRNGTRKDNYGHTKPIDAPLDPWETGYREQTVQERVL